MRDRLTKATTVTSALDTAGSQPVVVPETASIPEVAAAWEAHPEVRVICVVNNEGTLAGIIRSGPICDALFLHLAPEEFLADILEPDSLLEFRRLSQARRAADLMEEAEGVLADNSVIAAFRLMHSSDLEGLPVVDSEGKPIAYLDRLRLVAVWLRAHSTEGSA